jgi:hypothetical protein
MEDSNLILIKKLICTVLQVNEMPILYFRYILYYTIKIKRRFSYVQI